MGGREDMAGNIQDEEHVLAGRRLGREDLNGRILAGGLGREDMGRKKTWAGGRGLMDLVQEGDMGRRTVAGGLGREDIGRTWARWHGREDSGGRT
ncbi:hypothetical protein E2C01_087244 [Portunus trituberculatus]|uniref:Uncharacterized protein n=1 Tax=Portunus trituberculatus TaxID=210409 RepID=A0A5B7J2T4_PORTR|nr:hypothetical protein [Portunus trituberculatus]